MSSFVNFKTKLIYKIAFGFGVILLTGCGATLESFNESVRSAAVSAQESLKSTANKANSANGSKSTEEAAGLKQAGIYDIFVDVPYDEGNKTNHQWPRVAIEVLSTPANVNKFYSGQGISGIPKGCFDLKATIWKSRKSKKVTEPFQFCFENDIAYGVKLRDYQNWASGWVFTTTYRKHSGNSRKNILPPKSFAPGNIKYQRQFKNAFLSGNTYTADSILGIMLFSVAAHSGIDPAIRSDHRIWFTRIAPLN